MEKIYVVSGLIDHEGAEPFTIVPICASTREKAIEILKALKMECEDEAKEYGFKLKIEEDYEEGIVVVNYYETNCVETYRVYKSRIED